MKNSPFNLKITGLSLITGVICSIVSFGAAAQSTVVKGKITDAKTHEALPYVSVIFDGTNQGVSSAPSGDFLLAANSEQQKIKVSFVGYQTLVKEIQPGKVQDLNIELKEEPRDLKEVVIRSGAKVRYRNKNNPAVDLIRLVIEHKKENRIESYDFAEYHQYERMVFSLSNLSDKFKNKKMFRNYQFLFREQDSTAIGGKTLLPLYMEEKLSENYLRKAPFTKKQIVTANKQVKYDEHFIDNEGLATYFNRMYQDIEIYDNNISLLGNQLLSPIADGAPTFYKFFITDTLKDVSPWLIELSFTPRNTTDLLFEGKIYITMDGRYAVQSASLGVNKNINLNFVRQMQVQLAFEKTGGGRFYLNQSNLKIEFGLNKNKGGGIYGERVVLLNGFKVGQARPDSVYKGAASVTLAAAAERNDDYWKASRPDTLPAAQAGIYRDIDSLQHIPSFRRTLDIATLVLAGYKNYGPFEVGPLNTFYNFNPVEGFRLRLGGRTTTSLSKRFYAETYGAYGFKDDRFKYFLSGTYSLNNKSIYAFPQNFVRASFQHDTKIPGQELQFVQEDNFLLSFKRGQNDIWLYNDVFRLNYVHEYLSHFSYKFEFKKWNQSPAGALLFQNLVNDRLSDVAAIRTTEMNVELRYAPHEKYYQGKLYRTPIPDKYPVFTLRYQQGIKGLLGGQYNYSNITGNISKRFYVSQLGYTDCSTEGGYLAGKVPFALLDIHHANQTYALQLQSYNLMNFLEFASDHYAAINIDHNFNGFLFNKVPVLKKLRLREVISFKSLWGGVRAENDPQNDPNLLRFPSNADGRPITYTLNNGPYMEGSIGVSNIFRFLRVDMVERFSYLDHPDAPKYGLRVLAKLEF